MLLFKLIFHFTLIPIKAKSGVQTGGRTEEVGFTQLSFFFKICPWDLIKATFLPDTEMSFVKICWSQYFNFGSSASVLHFASLLWHHKFCWDALEWEYKYYRINTKWNHVGTSWQLVSKVTVMKVLSVLLDKKKKFQNNCCLSSSYVLTVHTYLGLQKRLGFRAFGFNSWLPVLLHILVSHLGCIYTASLTLMGALFSRKPYLLIFQSSTQKLGGKGTPGASP